MKDSKIIYGQSFGDVYVCVNYPKCDSYVGVHVGTTIPKGTLADKKLRDLRIQAHADFDKIWKSKKMTRSKAYKLMPFSY